MSNPRPSKMAWIRAGAALSLGALAFSMLGGRRAAAKLSARVAGAFLEAWGDRRLENRVARLLAKAEGADPARRAESAGPDIEALFAGYAEHGGRGSGSEASREARLGGTGPAEGEEGRARETGLPRRETHGEGGGSDAAPSRQHPEPT